MSKPVFVQANGQYFKVDVTKSTKANANAANSRSTTEQLTSFFKTPPTNGVANSGLPSSGGGRRNKRKGTHHNKRKATRRNKRKGTRRNKRN